MVMKLHGYTEVCEKNVLLIFFSLKKELFCFVDNKSKNDENMQVKRMKILFKLIRISYF